MPPLGLCIDIIEFPSILLAIIIIFIAYNYSVFVVPSLSLFIKTKIGKSPLKNV